MLLDLLLDRGEPSPLLQYSFIVFTMVGTLAASTSRRFSSADAAWLTRPGSTPTLLLPLMWLLVTLSLPTVTAVGAIRFDAAPG